MAVAMAQPVEDKLRQLNKRGSFPLTKFQQKQIDDASPIYIYNVSPIHEWPRFQGQLGTLTIRKKPADAELSEPLIVPGIVPRRFDKGLGRQEWFLDSGMEVAEDICGCSKEYPAESANNNLLNFGVFITTEPFAELTKKEQEKILDAANLKLDAKLRQLILEADQFASQKHENWIADIHRAALQALNEMTDGQEERPWAPIRTTKRNVACQFCGVNNKAGVAKCANCHEIIDHELYERLTKKKEK